MSLIKVGTALTKARVYSPEMPNRSTNLLNGEMSGILHWSDIPFPEFYESYMEGIENHWTADQISLAQDIVQFPTLPENTQKATKAIIGLLSGLDSAASRNILEVLLYIKEPSLWADFAWVAKEEVEHNRGYSYIIADILSRSEEFDVFETPKEEPLLLERNKIMMEAFQEFSDEKSVESMLGFLVHNITLEGIFFYSGFSFFYAMARQKILVGISTMINYINRDEMRHLKLLAATYRLILQQNPEYNTPEQHARVLDIITSAVEKEFKWDQYILDDIDGIDVEVSNDYLKYRANKILLLLGYDKYYEDVDENNILWIKRYEDNFSGNKTDFFEQHNRQYAKPTVKNGFDEL